MFALKVLQGFTHPDGRIFVEGHDCNSLSIFEASELLADYPDNFEGLNDVTVELSQNKETVDHYAEAARRKREEG